MSSNRLFPHLNENGMTFFSRGGGRGGKDTSNIPGSKLVFFSNSLNHKIFLIILKNRVNSTKYPNFLSLAPLEFF